MKKNDVITTLSNGRGDRRKLVKIATVTFTKNDNIRFKLKLEPKSNYFFKGIVGIDIKYNNNNVSIQYAWEGLQYTANLEDPEAVKTIRFEKVNNNVINIYYRYISGYDGVKFTAMNDCDYVTLYSNQPILEKINDMNISPSDCLPEEKVEKSELKEIHSRGVDGTGVKIAVIDSDYAKSNSKLTIDKEVVLNGQSKHYGEHATACASIIKSSEFGIAPKSTLYSLSLTENKVDVKFAKELAERIIWCADNDIDIISISLGFAEKIECNELLEACQYADRKGVIIVAGAGNNGIKSDENFAYTIIPGAYDYTICVSNVDVKTNKLAELSSRGYGIDFAGYGDGNKAYKVNGNTFEFKGTSSATPYIAGCIALIKQQLPSLNRYEVYEILKSIAIKLDKSEKSLQYGYGLINPTFIPKDYKYKTRDFLERLFLIKDFYFKENNITLKPGDIYEPEIVFTPNNDIKSFVTFKSSDENVIATEYQKPYLKALREGQTTITAFLGNGKNTQLFVEVKSDSKDNEDDKPIVTKEYESLKSLGIYDCWEKGFKGQGIKVGYIGWGCIDTPNINIRERYNVNNLPQLECNGGLGTQLSSLISGNNVGIAPECEYYVLNPAFDTSGSASLLDIHKCADWAISKNLDIVFIQNLEFTFPPNKTYPSSFDVCKPENVKKLIQNMHDKGIIPVTIIDDSSDNINNSLVANENTLTISYVTNKKEYPSNNNPAQSNWVDCVSYGYGMNVLDITEKELLITENYINDKIDGEYYASAQICGLLALLKQQNPNLKTAQDVRKILPNVCETLYGGKNDKTGYGLLKANLDALT